VGYLQTSMKSVLEGLKEQVAGIVADPANYGNSGANGSSGATGAPSAGGNSVPDADKEAAIKFFMGKGWTRAQAAGIVANLIKESGLKAHGPNGDNGTATGVAQWRGGRQTKFKELFGKDLSQATLEEQLAYVDWELRNSHKAAGDRLKNASTPYDAAGIVCRYYEIPSDIPAKSAERGNLANQIA
jgi:hypothetical protein